ncbi:RraA family protein [Rhodococcus koreensis]
MTSEKPVPRATHAHASSDELAGTSANTHALLTADDRRYEFLLDGDVASLESALDDDFAYIHSTGREEDKESFIRSIASGRVRYRGVDLEERSVWIHNDIGTMRGRVTLDIEIEARPRHLELSYLSVWERQQTGWIMRYWSSAPLQSATASNSSAPLISAAGAGADESHEISPSIREKLSKVGIATIANVLLRRGLKRPVIRGLVPVSSNQKRMVGPAFTLRFIPSREDLDSMEAYGDPGNPHRRAIEECPPEAVLVIDANGCTDVSSMGDLMAMRLHHRGVAGAVTDGGFRDTAGIADVGLPCFQRAGATPATPIALHSVALNEPIGCGGVSVYPGDVLVGDSDGVVVIPRKWVEEVADEAADASDYEEFVALAIRQGRSILDILPATPEGRKEYETWVASGRPGMEQS